MPKSGRELALFTSATRLVRREDIPSAQKQYAIACGGSAGDMAHIPPSGDHDQLDSVFFMQHDHSNPTHHVSCAVPNAQIAVSASPSKRANTPHHALFQLLNGSMVQRRGVEAGEELTWDYGNEYPYPVPLRSRRLYRIPASPVRSPGTHAMPQRSVVPALNNTPAFRSTRASDRAQRSRSVITGICPSFEECKSPIAKTTRLAQPVFTTRLRAPALAQCMLGQVCTPRVGPVGRGEGWIPCPHAPTCPCPYMPQTATCCKKATWGQAT